MINVRLKVFKKLARLFLVLILKRLRFAIINPPGAASVDLNPAIFLLALAELGAFFIRVDDGISERHRDRRDAFVKEGVLPRRSERLEIQIASPAARFNRRADQL